MLILNAGDFFCCPIKRVFWNVKQKLFSYPLPIRAVAKSGWTPRYVLVYTSYDPFTTSKMPKMSVHSYETRIQKLTTHVAICNRRDMGPMLDTSARCRVPMSGRRWNDNAGRCRGEFASKMSVRYRWSISSRYHGDVFFGQKINYFELFSLITDVWSYRRG